MSQNKFLKGAAILGIAGILVKVMGVFFRIPLTNWVGADGISYYLLFDFVDGGHSGCGLPHGFRTYCGQQLRRRA